MKTNDSKEKKSNKRLVVGVILILINGVNILIFKYIQTSYRIEGGYNEALGWASVFYGLPAQQAMYVDLLRSFIGFLIMICGVWLCWTETKSSPKDRDCRDKLNG